MYSDAPDFSGEPALACLLALVAAWPVAALVARAVGPVFVRRVWPRLNAPVAVPRSLRRAARALVGAGVAFVALPRRLAGACVAGAAARSEVVYGWVCRRRAERVRYVGLTNYEEWRAELAAVPSAAVRRQLLAEIDRYAPSGRLVRRARALAGRRCADVRREESYRVA